ncbi:MAG: hypothetical protein ACYS72_01360 [Planctomycetota bacterium]|jgi:hypothetical protein
MARGMVAVLLLIFSGCNIFGFLASAGWHEKPTVPAYDLKARQDRKVMIWVECPRSAGADFEVPQKLAGVLQLMLIEKGEFEPENVIVGPALDSGNSAVDLRAEARSLGAGYVLLVHVDSYSIDSLRVRDYYSGEMVTRAVLQDTDLGTRVWPQQPEGKMVHVGVEIETKGRDALVSRMISAAAHCTLRNLYPCDKLKFKHADERISMQEAYEIETY